MECVGLEPNFLSFIILDETSQVDGDRVFQVERETSDLFRSVGGEVEYGCEVIVWNGEVLEVGENHVGLVRDKNVLVVCFEALEELDKGVFEGQFFGNAKANGKGVVSDVHQMVIVGWIFWNVVVFVDFLGFGSSFWTGGCVAWFGRDGRSGFMS